MIKLCSLQSPLNIYFRLAVSVSKLLNVELIFTDLPCCVISVYA